MKHTKLPWRVREACKSDIMDSENNFLISVLDEANAEYICRAVNSYEGLVEAAKSWLQHLESHISDLEPGYYEIIALQKLIKAADGEGV